MRLLLGASVAAWLLAPCPGHAADGLQRFEKLLPTLQGELKKEGGGEVHYARGTAMGNAGFALDDVTIAIPADPAKPGSKPSKAKIKRIVVEDLDFDRIDLKHPDAPTTGPYFVKMSVEGLTVDGDVQQQVSALGLPVTSLDLALDYRYEEARKVLMLNKLEVRLPGLASLDLAMILDNVAPPGPDAAKHAQDDTTLRTATLTLDDHSLLSHVVPIGSAMAGVPVEQGLAMLREMLGAMLNGQSEASLANADALVSFATDWQAPKGPLTIRLTPASNAGFADVKKIDSPDAAQKILGLSISYSGTRAGVASAGSPGGAVAGLCAPNSRVFLRDNDDGSLTAATVIEATGSGRCVVRKEGAAKGDDTVAEQEALRRWSIDGPGEPLAACELGKSVLALSDGTWSPGKIKAKGSGGKCEVKWEDQEESEELPLTSIRIATDN
jgi:hypothetical protein